MVVLVREHETLVSGVVVIPEHSLARDDFDVVDPGAIENAGGSFSAGDPRKGRHLAVPHVDPLYAPCRPERQRESAEE
jgi:hypothetical protein